VAARRPAANVAAEQADERLLVEAAQRDPVKFGALYELHFEQVYAFISRRVADRTLAEDLTSDVFQKALANLGSYEFRGAPFAAWLIRIAANALADQSKRNAREIAASSGDPPEPSLQPDLEEIEHRAHLFRLVKELPGDQRLVIYQRFVDQKSIREIAQEMSRSEGAVKQLQFRALQSLREQMEGGHA
jgi:RNA polymerase sigma-70 factor (ECF subfamily)